MIRYNLQDVISEIKSKNKKISVIETGILEKEFCITDLPIKKLTELGFELVGESTLEYPIYRLGSLECTIIDNVFHIYQWLK